MKSNKSMASIAQPKWCKDDFDTALRIISEQPWLESSDEALRGTMALCDNDSQRTMLEVLLKNFFHLDSGKERIACASIAEKISDYWGLDFNNSWVVPVSDGAEIDGSVAGLQTLKIHITPEDMWINKFVPNIKNCISKVNEGDVIILFDDFIGSGHKIVKKLNFIKRQLCIRGLNVDRVGFFVIGFVGMRFGVSLIKKAMQCDVHVGFMLEKGISRANFASQYILPFKEEMRLLEGKLQKKCKKRELKKFSLGYQRTQALYCKANSNCPNNVFPIFWWSRLRGGEERKHLLTRVDASRS